ncbi:MAG: TldD/PmbA family protein [Actinomycetota bacterium]|nr:TldD/PmbA family protein [Actinomycetota bacterium]
MPGLVGSDDVRRIAEAALEIPGADSAEVLFLHEWSGLTRFAESAIHQSTAREDTGLRVRVISQGRVGVAATNELSKEGATAAARSALELASMSAPDPMFPGLAPPADVPDVSSRFDEATASTTPDLRADWVAQLVGRCEPGFHAAGAFETTAMEVALANSEGHFCYAPSTQATMTTVVSGGDGGTGFAEVTDRRLEELDPASIGERAFRKARDSQGPRDLDADRYEVVLEPAAVATLLGFLAYLGFGGRAIAEGRSCFSDRLGEQLMSERVTIYDDALSPQAVGLPFDFEGTPKRRVNLVERGVVRGGVHDRRSAKQAGTESTGHALPPPNPEGAFPLNMFLEEGDASVDDMIGATSRGLLVTRFHYSNVVHPKDAIITGMTRDGTWLVEDGEIKHPVKNFRFTQSIIEALRNVEQVGKDSDLASEFFFASSRTPALRISAFQFTGKSDH